MRSNVIIFIGPNRADLAAGGGGGGGGGGGCANAPNAPSMATGLLCVQPEFDAFSTLVRGEMRNSNPRG